MAVLTIQYEVGEDRTAAIVRLYNTVLSNQDPRALAAGMLPPLIKPMGIDDVPIVTVTLWTDDPARGAHDLQRVGHALEAELKRVPGTRDVYTIGGPDNVVHVVLDPQRLAAYGLSLDSLHQALVGGERRRAGRLDRCPRRRNARHERHVPRYRRRRCRARRGRARRQADVPRRRGRRRGRPRPTRELRALRHGRGRGRDRSADGHRRTGRDARDREEAGHERGRDRERASRRACRRSKAC